MSHYSFEFPYAFLLLGLFWFCSVRCPARTMAIYMPYLHLLLGDKRLRSHWLEIVKWVAIVSFVTALASPVKVTNYNNIKRDAHDIMLVLDSSKSMLDRGFDSDNPKRDKFSAVVAVIKSFINSRRSDRIGIINFASSAFIASPLTFDKSFLNTILEKQKVGLVGSKTAIYDALLQALYILESSDSKSKIAILLTDGMDNMSTTSFGDIEDLLKKSKIKLYIIGIGDDKSLEIEKLKKLAKLGDGEFFLATNNKALAKIYKEINRSETTKIKAQSYKEYTYYYYFPLMIAIVLFLIFVYLKSVKGVAR